MNQQPRYLVDENQIWADTLTTDQLNALNIEVDEAALSSMHVGERIFAELEQGWDTIKRVS